MVKARIMIVEDESIVAMGIKHKLEDLGYTVVGIESRGTKAVETAFNTEPDLILMDIVLKGNMDGIEVAERIHNRLDTPIIYLTAYSDEEVLRRARITEPYGFILKPFKKSEVNANIEMALYKHEADKKKSDSLKKKILADFYDFILTPMPTSTGSDIEIRQMLLKIFEERLEEDLYPKFAEYFESLEFEDENELFETFMEWVSEIFNDFGIKTTVSSNHDRLCLNLFNCPWITEVKKKPMFCLNCQAIIHQSYIWTGLTGIMDRKSTIADGYSRCTFMIRNSGV